MSNLHWSESGNWKTVISASWKLNSELIKLIYALVVVDAESGIDINDDNCFQDVQDNYGLYSGSELRKWLLPVKSINKNGKCFKIVGHPNWRESKQAFSIIFRESPLQSASLQTLHPSNDNLIFLLDILTAFQSALLTQQDSDTLYPIQTQSCEKSLTKNY